MGRDWGEGVFCKSGFYVEFHFCENRCIRLLAEDREGRGEGEAVIDRGGAVAQV